MEGYFFLFKLLKIPKIYYRPLTSSLLPKLRNLTLLFCRLRQTNKLKSTSPLVKSLYFGVVVAIPFVVA